MRTRIFSTPTSGTPTAVWQDGDATTGKSGSLLPFTTPGGLPAGAGGNLQGPGTFISAQFSLSTPASTLLVALATNGATDGVSVRLESYGNFAWTALDSASLASTSTAAVSLPAAQLVLLRLRVTVSGNASAQCVPLLNTTGTPQGGGGGGTTPVSTNERTGLVNIPPNVDRVTIAFSPAFAGVPLPPICQVLKAADSDDNISCVAVESLTVNQCVALLSSTTANGNYKLSFRAVSAS